ncbi:DUF805 domain-containing protein [Pseudonocardia humida]|uniref:DUF805 domain-containing protein n=1 Tax=Pseudonocardia humida TaxID=2800819 RepID=A0ABT0ZWU9_9PSEU|nr:DUF805 domain-containing protein [Pseudonocardia humida]MCO1655114.1 DUF805 domain-containing protein [Pseudonocardia humida]
MGWYLQTLRRFTDFSGRSRRRELWPFLAVNVVLGAIASAVDAALGFGGYTTVTAPGYAGFTYSPGIIAVVVGLVLLVPSLAVEVRRLHDTGRSAWWLLIVLVPLAGVVVLIVFWALEGQRGENAYGPDPKAAEPAMA